MARPKTDTSLPDLWILFNGAGWVTAYVISRYQRGSSLSFVAIPMYRGRRSLDPAHAVLVRPFGKTGKFRIQPLEISLQVKEPARVHGPVKDALSHPNVIYWGKPFNMMPNGSARDGDKARAWHYFLNESEWCRITREHGPFDEPPK